MVRKAWEGIGQLDLLGYITKSRWVVENVGR